MTTIFGNPGSTELLSPLYNHRDDSWGGDPERRLRFPFECMRAIRAAVGHEPFVGYRINSTSFWPGDLETADIVDTRWPMISMGRILDVYLEWIYPRLYAADVEMITDMWATGIEGRNVTLSLVHDHYRQTTRTLGPPASLLLLHLARRRCRRVLAVIDVAAARAMHARDLDLQSLATAIAQLARPVTTRTGRSDVQAVAEALHQTVQAAEQLRPPAPCAQKMRPERLASI
jgi:hypothetical protein